MTCQKCEGTGWIYRRNGMVRCVCRTAPVSAKPLSERDVVELLIAAGEAADQLDAFPDYYTKAGRRIVADALASMCWTPEQVRYVVRRATSGVFSSWKGCGIPGLRQIAVSKFRPRDGIESGPGAISEAYPEGIPSELDGRTGYQQIESAGMKALPAGSPQSENPQLAAAVDNLGEKKRMPHAIADARISEKRVNTKLEQMGV